MKAIYNQSVHDIIIYCMNSCNFILNKISYRHIVDIAQIFANLIIFSPIIDTISIQLIASAVMLTRSIDDRI